MVHTLEENIHLVYIVHYGVSQLILWERVCTTLGWMLINACINDILVDISKWYNPTPL